MGRPARHGPASDGSAAGTPRSRASGWGLAVARECRGVALQPPQAECCLHSQRSAVNRPRIGRSAAGGGASRRRADAAAVIAFVGLVGVALVAGALHRCPCAGGEKAADDTAVAAARQAFVGEWKLNKASSDDPRAKMREGRPAGWTHLAAPEGGAAAARGGWPGGRGGGPGRWRLGRWASWRRGGPCDGWVGAPAAPAARSGMLFAADRITITNLTPEITIVAPEGELRTLHADDKGYERAAAGRSRRAGTAPACSSRRRASAAGRRRRGRCRQSRAGSPCSWKCERPFGGTVKIKRVFDPLRDRAPRPRACGMRRMLPPQPDTPRRRSRTRRSLSRQQAQGSRRSRTIVADAEATSPTIDSVAPAPTPARPAGGGATGVSGPWPDLSCNRRPASAVSSSRCKARVRGVSRGSGLHASQGLFSDMKTRAASRPQLAKDAQSRGVPARRASCCPPSRQRTPAASQEPSGAAGRVDRGGEQPVPADGHAALLHPDEARRPLRRAQAA